LVIDRQWAQLTPLDWDWFADAWLSELRGKPLGPDDMSQRVVFMNFTAAPSEQWLFIRLAVAKAESDDELGSIAAGPMEHLLGWHGEAYIGHVEKEAAANETFARMLTGVWQYRMAAEVWRRVQEIQARVQRPLREPAGN